MGNWKVWTAFISVFIAGTIVGVVGVGLVMQHQFSRAHSHGEFREMMKNRMLSEIRDEVRPDASAMPEIEKILNDLTRELEAFRKTNQPRIKKIFENGKQRIRQHLTPEQAKRFDAMSEKRRKGNFGFLRFPPPPPPPLD